MIGTQRVIQYTTGMLVMPNFSVPKVVPILSLLRCDRSENKD